MSDLAIRVENLSKLYHIGKAQKRHDTLRDAIANRGLQIANLIGRNRNSQFANRNSDDTIWALKDVSFDVKRGEVVGIIGRNGAGKSTLLKILSRITEPTKGRAIIDGRVGSLLEVGTGFHPELTGRENIYLNGAILGMKRAEIDRKFDEIVAFAEIEKFLDTPVKHYSSGMYVRLAFAVAAHLEPEILLVDEVLAVGDAAFQKKCLGKMGDVAKEGRTVLFVSHNMGAIEKLCSRVFLIRGGTLQKVGVPSEVIGDYLGDALKSGNGLFDYSNHLGRSTIYEPIIKSVMLRTSSGEGSTFFYPDESLQIEITIEPSRPIRDPRVAVAIEDHIGHRILTVASYFHVRNLPDIESRSIVLCTMPRLNLGSGRYLLSVSVATKYGGLLDSVDGGAWFDVGWRNNYGNGESYLADYGPVLVESIWKEVD